MVQVRSIGFSATSAKNGTTWSASASHRPRCPTTMMSTSVLPVARWHPQQPRTIQHQALPRPVSLRRVLLQTPVRAPEQWAVTRTLQTVLASQHQHPLVSIILRQPMVRPSCNSRFQANRQIRDLPQPNRCLHSHRVRMPSATYLLTGVRAAVITRTLRQI